MIRDVRARIATHERHLIAARAMAARLGPSSETAWLALDSDEHDRRCRAWALALRRVEELTSPRTSLVRGAA